MPHDTIILFVYTMCFVSEEKSDALKVHEETTASQTTKRRTTARLCNIFAEKQFELMLQRDNFVRRVKDGEDIDLDRMVIATVQFKTGTNASGGGDGGSQHTASDASDAAKRKQHHHHSDDATPEKKSKMCEYLFTR